MYFNQRKKKEKHVQSIHLSWDLLEELFSFLRSPGKDEITKHKTQK